MNHYSVPTPDSPRREFPGDELYALAKLGVGEGSHGVDNGDAIGMVRDGFRKEVRMCLSDPITSLAVLCGHVLGIRGDAVEPQRNELLRRCTHRTAPAATALRSRTRPTSSVVTTAPHRLAA